MTECKTVMELFNYLGFTPEEAIDTKRWFDRVAAAFQEAETLIDLNAPIMPLFGGNLLILTTQQDLLENPLPACGVDVWGNLGDNGIWCTVINNNTGGPTYFIIREAARVLKSLPHLKMYLPEVNFQDASNN